MAGTDVATQAANRDALDQARRNMSAVILAGYGPNATEKTMHKVGVLCVNNVKRTIRSSGASGRQYGRRGPGRPPHRASAPGEAPASDSGRLMRSYTHMVGVDTNGAYVDVGTNIDYAPFLEFGTSKMLPRPHLRPAIDSARAELMLLVREEITSNQKAAIASLKGGGGILR